MIQQKFNGEMFRFETFRRTKKQAQSIAQQLRKIHYKARVIKIHNGYAIWRSVKKK